MGSVTKKNVKKVVAKKATKKAPAKKAPSKKTAKKAAKKVAAKKVAAKKAPRRPAKTYTKTVRKSSVTGRFVSRDEFNRNLRTTYSSVVTVSSKK